MSYIPHALTRDANFMSALPHVLMLALALYLTGLYSIAREYRRVEAGPIGLAALLSWAFLVLGLL